MDDAAISLMRLLLCFFFQCEENENNITMYERASNLFGFSYQIPQSAMMSNKSILFEKLYTNPLKKKIKKYTSTNADTKQIPNK